MDRLSKSFAVLFILIMVLSSLSLLMVKPAYAQSSIDLNIPEFTVQIVAHPYDVPPSQSIDPYTGKVTTQNGYHVENKTIEMKIKNQAVSNNTHLYFGIREKGHFGQTWNTYTDENSHKPSNSDYTVLSIPIIYPPNSQVDYQVETFVGYNIYHSPTGGTPIGSGWYFTIVKESGWSNIKTLNLTDGSVSITPFTNPTPSTSPTQTTSPTPTATLNSPSPTVPEFSFIIVIIVIVVLSLANSVFKIKTR